MRLMTDLETAWLAGILEGEGSFETFTLSHCVRVKLKMTDKDIIERAAKLMDGTVKQERTAPPRKAAWRVRVGGERAICVMKAIRPYMGERRRKRIDECLERASRRLSATDRQRLSVFSRAINAGVIALTILAFSICTGAQGYRYQNTISGPRGPLANVPVAVCTQPATISSAPCSPLATLYTDSTLTTACNGTNGCSNPLTSDGYGNVLFYAAPGKYTIQYYGPQFSAPVAYQDIVLPCDPSNCNATVGNINGVRYVSTGNPQGWSGSDAGAWIDAAYADCAANTECPIYYNFSSPVSYTTTIAFTTKGKYPKLVNQGTCAPAASIAGVIGSCLNYTPTSGDAIDLDYYDASAVDPPSGSGLYGVGLINNQCVTTNGCGGTADGIHVLSVNGGASNIIFNNVSILGFGGFGYLNTNNVSANAFWRNPYFKANAVAMQTGSFAERFEGGQFSGNGCVELAPSSAGPELYFTNTLTFGNTTGPSCSAEFSMSTNLAHIHLANVHLENSSSTNAHYVTGNYILSMEGGVAEDDNSTGTGDWMFNLSSTQSTVLMHGVSFASSRPYTNVFQMGGSGARASVQAINESVGNLTCSNFVGGGQASAFTGMLTEINSGVSSPCNWGYESPLQARGALAGLTGTGACATLSSQNGGSWDGEVTCTGTTGASTLVITPGTTAPNHWECSGSDVTSGHELALPQSGLSATTCTLKASSVTANDVLSFRAVAH